MLFLEIERFPEALVLDEEFVRDLALQAQFVNFRPEAVVLLAGADEKDVSAPCGMEAVVGARDGPFEETRHRKRRLLEEDESSAFDLEGDEPEQEREDRRHHEEFSVFSGVFRHSKKPLPV